MNTPQKTKRPFLASVFVSPSEPRLRAGWRLLIQTVIMLIIASIGGIAMAIIPAAWLPDPSGQLRSGIVETLMITGSVIIARFWLDRRSFSSLGFRLNKNVLPDLLIGIAIPFGLMAVIFVVELGAGWLKFNGFAWQDLSAGAILSQLFILLVAFIAVGWNEELLSRGYHLQTLASGTNLFWGLLLSSAVFGMLHLANPNSENKIMVALGILGAGLFLAYGFLRTGQLWLSIGLHIGWNFFEGPIFGFPVSGTASFHLTRITVSGPQLWTGGGFGPEAGLVVIPALLLGAGLIYLVTRNRPHVTKIT